MPRLLATVLVLTAAVASPAPSSPIPADDVPKWREDLRVMAGPTRHPQRLAAGKLGAGGFDRVLEGRIHYGRRAGANALYRDAAGAARGCLSRDGAQPLLQALDHGAFGIADLEQHLGATGDDAGCAGI